MSAPAILASASPARQVLLRNAGIDVEIKPAAIDESAIRAASSELEPEALALSLARAKAAAVARDHPGRLVIAADQLLAHHGALLTKPGNRQAARAQLARLRATRHHLINGVVLWRDDDCCATISNRVALLMRDFSDDFLDQYLRAEGDALFSSVGAYRLEGPGIQLFDAIDGDFFSVLGLPLLPLLSALRHQGVIAA